LVFECKKGLLLHLGRWRFENLSFFSSLGILSGFLILDQERIQEGEVIRNRFLLRYILFFNWFGRYKFILNWFGNSAQSIDFLLIMSFFQKRIDKLWLFIILAMFAFLIRVGKRLFILRLAKYINKRTHELMKLIDSIFSFLFAPLNLLLSLLNTCPFFKLVQLLEYHLVTGVRVHVINRLWRVGHLPQFFVLYLLAFY
jgi:hypothetical protein